MRRSLRPIKVLHSIGSLTRGGAQKQLELLVGRIDASRFETGILFFEGDVYGEGELPPGLASASPTLLRIERGSRWDLAGVSRRVAERIDSFQPDIVHNWLPEVLTIPAARAARKRGVPIIGAQRRRLSQPRDVWRYIALSMATTVVSNYDPAHDPAPFRALFRRRSGTVIRNGLDSAAIAALPALSLPDYRRPEMLLVYTGRLAPHKRVDLAIESVSRLGASGRCAGLLVCGGGSAEEQRRLERLVADRGLAARVRFLGFRRDWHSLLKGADAFVLPSLSEGMSNVLLEAAAAGATILCTGIRENKELFTHGRNAWLVEPDDPNALFAGLDKLYGEPKLRAELSAGAQELAASYSVDRMVEAYERLYTDLAG